MSKSGPVQMQGIDFRKLDLPIGLIEIKSEFPFSFSDFSFSDVCAPLLLVYRCRFIVLFFALWSSVVYIGFRDIRLWGLSDWIFIVISIVIPFFTVFLRRIYFSYMRVDGSIRAWRAISWSIASFADSVKLDLLELEQHQGDLDSDALQAQLRLQKTALAVLEELAVALGLYKHIDHEDPTPREPTGRDKDLADEFSPAAPTPTPTQETPLSPNFSFRTFLHPLHRMRTQVVSICRLFLRDPFPQIPSQGDGMDAEVYYRPPELVRSQLFEVVWIPLSRGPGGAGGNLNGIDGDDDVRVGIATVQARLHLREQIITNLETLWSLRPVHWYIVHLWISTTIVCLFLPLGIVSLTGWRCIPITIAVAAFLYSWLVVADDNDHMINKCFEDGAV